MALPTAVADGTDKQGQAALSSTKQRAKPSYYTTTRGGYAIAKWWLPRVRLGE